MGGPQCWMLISDNTHVQCHHFCNFLVNLLNVELRNPVCLVIHLSPPVTKLYYGAYRMVVQCPKLRVHPAPGAHIFTARCTIFGGVHPLHNS